MNDHSPDTPGGVALEDLPHAPKTTSFRRFLLGCIDPCSREILTEAQDLTRHLVIALPAAEHVGTHVFCELA